MDFVNFAGLMRICMEQRLRIRVYKSSQRKGVETVACMRIIRVKRGLNEKVTAGYGLIKGKCQKLSDESE